MTAEITPLLEMDLPAQNLELALQAFSQATGMAVLVDLIVSTFKGRKE